MTLIHISGHRCLVGGRYPAPVAGPQGGGRGARRHHPRPCRTGSDRSGRRAVSHAGRKPDIVILAAAKVGSGTDISILDLAPLVAQTLGFKGEIDTDLNKPDGMMRKLMGVWCLEHMGWKARIALEDKMHMLGAGLWATARRRELEGLRTIK